MKHYLDRATGDLYAYEADGSQDAHINPNTVRLDDALVSDFIQKKNTPGATWDGNHWQPPTSTSPFAWQELQLRAQAALAKSDITMVRCVEEGLSVPPTWVAYRNALRAIVAAPTGNAAGGLPNRPPYP